MEFAEKMKPWQRYLGIFWACFCSFGGVLLTLALHHFKVGNEITNTLNILIKMLEILILVVFIPVIFKSLKQQKPLKIILWSILLLVINFSLTIFCRFSENNLIAYLGLTNKTNLNSQMLQSQLESPTMWKMVYSAISIGIIGPLIEEISYRICLFGTLRKNHRILSHLITAFLFGFQHISMAVILFNKPEEFVYIFSYMVTSLVWTIAYAKLKTPVPGIACHMLNNSLSIIFSIK